MKIINELIQECHKTSVEKGFYDNVNPFDERFISTQIALMHSEISEALEEVLNNRYGIYYREDGKPEGFVIELADFLIRMFDLCGALNLDLATALTIVEKHCRIVIDEELHVIKELALLHKELTEALEQVRDSKYSMVYMGNSYVPKGMVCEFAHCYNHIVKLCDVTCLCLPIYEAIKIKTEYNKKRQYKHGRHNF